MKLLKNIVIFIVVLAVALPVLVLANGYRQYCAALEKMPLEEKVAEIQSIDNYCELSRLPENYINAVVAVEDRRFFSHNGFDLIGIVRAVWVDIKTRSLKEGGSTISQQLAKNMYFPRDNTIERKIAEIFMAVHIEKEYSKEDVLELYFNCIYYGSGYYCVYDAAMGYFGKEPEMMNDYECTLLAGVPNAPSAYSPKVNPDLAHNRQEKVLSTMVECGYIDKEKQAEILAVQNK